MTHKAESCIVRARKRKFLSAGLENFLLRVGRHLHFQDVRILIKAGCLDSIARGLQRPSLMWRALRFFGGQHQEEISPTLFPAPPALLPVRHAPYPKKLMLQHEVDTLGFLLSLHPLEQYQSILKNVDYVRACDLRVHVGKGVTAVGWLVTGKTVHTRDGEPMKFISFEDTTGLYETVFFPKAYNQFCHMLNGSRPYILKGRVEEEFGSITLTVSWMGFLDRYKGDASCLTR